MSSPFVGEIRSVAFLFAPRGWADCSGQTLAISQNTALFSLLGTNYGGNGTTTFSLPNLNGRALVSAGNGPGLSNYSVGQEEGAAYVTLAQTELPSHIHLPKAAIDSTGPGNSHTVPVAGDQLTRYSAATGIALAWNTPPLDSPVALAPQMVQPTGANQPHDNMQPYTTLRYIIALQGIFPARN